MASCLGLPYRPPPPLPHSKNDQIAILVSYVAQCSETGLFPVKDVQTTSSKISVLISWFKYYVNVPKRVKTDKKIMLKFIENWPYFFSTKITITWKMKIWKLIFNPFQHISHLLCKYEHFLKQKQFRYWTTFYSIEDSSLNWLMSELWITFANGFYFRIEDSRLIWLVSESL